MSKIGKITVFCCILMLFTTTTADDPCIEGNFKYLHSAGLRGTSCKKKEGEEVCDRYIHNGWYKVFHEDEKAPRQLFTGPVGLDRCGTAYPVWMNSSHPTFSQNIVNRTAYMTGLRTSYDRTFNIQIKKCRNGDFVYRLQRLSKCFAAYCFGNNVPCIEPNPCKKDNRVSLPVNGDRSSSCSDEKLSFCDISLKETWYKVTMNDQPLKIPTHCVTSNHCGTLSPIWMNGTVPTIADKTVTRKACVNKGNVCTCEKSYDIRVRNCTDYIVYKLKSPSSCPERYCFGTTSTCAKTQKTDSDDFLKYLYWILAAVLLVTGLTSASGYIWFKNSNKIRDTPGVSNQKELPDPKLEISINMKSKP